MLEELYTTAVRSGDWSYAKLLPSLRHLAERVPVVSLRGRSGGTAVAWLAAGSIVHWDCDTAPPMALRVMDRVRLPVDAQQRQQPAHAVCVDGVHDYPKLTAMLTDAGKSTHRYLVLLGTRAYPVRAPNGVDHGMLPTIAGWLRDNKHWFLSHNLTDGTGAIVLSRHPQDRQITLPRPWPAGVGAGTALHRILGRFGIKPGPNCDCVRHAIHMDSAGIPWCLENIDVIVDWLRQEAAKQSLPFFEGIARRIVKRAIATGAEDVAKAEAEQAALSAAVGYPPVVVRQKIKARCCVYLGAKIGEHDDKALHACALHGKCVTMGGGADMPSCDTCDGALLPNADAFAERWRDPLVVLDRSRQPTHALRDMLAGRSVFLVCGGPSANLLPLEDLGRRGVWSMCVNNMAGHGAFRPQAMFCSDPPSKFSHSVWLDPGIMKFIPIPKLTKSDRGALRRRLPSGEFVPLRQSPNGPPLRTVDMPNVWAYARREWLLPDDSFFLDSEASIGNFKAGVERTGEPKTVCTMLGAMRMLRYLGARRVFLVGVDFTMSPTYGYAFPEGRDAKAAASNNEQYAVANNWLCRLAEAGVFTRFGIEFYNCNPTSGLRAFTHVPFADALRAASDGIEDKPILKDWYVK